LLILGVVVLVLEEEISAFVADRRFQHATPGEHLRAAKELCRNKAEGAPVNKEHACFAVDPEEVVRHLEGIPNSAPRLTQFRSSDPKLCCAPRTFKDLQVLGSSHRNG
jgi:hypothetical protein